MKLKHLLVSTAALLCSVGMWAQASFNHTYTVGVEPADGGDYFLYNIGAGQFLTNGLNYGTRATVDNSGRVLTLATATNGYSIYTNYVSLNNRTVAKAGYLTTNGYVDTGNNDAGWVFTPVTVDGYTNAYTISNSDTQYLYFDTNDCPVNVGANTNNNYSYWLLIPKATREAAGDYSHYLINTQMNCAWEFKTWGGSTAWNDNAVLAPGGLVSNRCAEKFHATSDVTQTIKEASSLPEGRYKLYVQGFWRQDGSDEGPVLYANEDTQTLAVLNANDENTTENMDGASTSFTNGLYVNSVETFVNADKLKVGININSTSQWVIFDNFVLDYIGQCVMDYAVALPNDGTMETDTWYYFDVTVDGNDYMATATTLGDIICTTDGHTLTSDTPTDVIELTAENNSFTTQRYYVKSSSANNLKIGASSYTYSISDATIDMTYVQEGNTVTINYTVSTNDLQTPLTQDYSGVTFGGQSVSVTPTAAGFTFTVPAVTPATDYTLSIPAGAIKYNEENKNEAQEFTLKTPAIFDGTYYLYNPYTSSFLSRGHSYGTAAVVDNYGVPFNLTTDQDGYSTIQFVDNSLYLYNTYWLFADGGTPDKFTIAAQTVGDYTGYAFYNKNLASYNRLYVYVNEGNENHYRVAGNANVGDNCANEEQTVWQVKTIAEHNAIVNAYPTTNIQNVISASGISTTSDAFTSFLAANYVATDVTSLIGTASFDTDAGDWTWAVVRGQNSWPQYTNNIARIYQATGTFTQTIDKANLPAGIYKVTVQAFDRHSTETLDKSFATNYGSLSSSYLKANDQQVRIMSWVEANASYGSETNSWNSQADCINTYKAPNELYIYLDGATNLTLTMAKPNYCADSYMIFNNFTLTRYEEPSVTVSCKAGKFGTTIIPFTPDVSTGFDDIKFYTVSSVNATTGNVQLTEVTTPEANVPYLIKNEGSEDFSATLTGANTASADSYTFGLLTGVYTAATIAASTETEVRYVLQTQDGTQAFYKVESDFTATPYKCFLTVPVETAGNVKAFTFDFGGNAVAIKALEADTENATIYNLAGQRLTKAQPGVNIISGRKVIIK